MGTGKIHWFVGEIGEGEEMGSEEEGGEGKEEELGRWRFHGCFEVWKINGYLLLLWLAFNTH